MSDERQSIRSPTPSRSDSYGDSGMRRGSEDLFRRRSSGIEENERLDNEYEGGLDDADERITNAQPSRPKEDPYVSALRYRFPNRAKNDYSYSRPTGPLNTPSVPSVPSTSQLPGATPPITPAGSGTYQTTSKPPSSTYNSNNASNGKNYTRPPLRPVNPNQQNNYARRLTNEVGTTTGTVAPPPPPPPPPPPFPTTTGTATTTTTPISQPLSGPSGPSVRINEQNNQSYDPVSSAYPSLLGAARPGESIFEKVSSNGGPISYLGIGTFSQFEHCLRECLARERARTGFESQIIRHDIPANMPVYDCGFDSTLVPPLPRHHEYNYGYDSTLIPPSPPHRVAYPGSFHDFIGYSPRSAAMIGLDDIRNINVALSRSGIPIFPPYHSYHDSYRSSSPPPPPLIPYPTFTAIHHSYPSSRHMTGEVVSACRLADEDNGSHAVQNVWSAIQNCRSSSYNDRSRLNFSPMGPYDM